MLNFKCNIHHHQHHQQLQQQMFSITQLCGAFISPSMLFRILPSQLFPFPCSLYLSLSVSLPLSTLALCSYVFSFIPCNATFDANALHVHFIYYKNLQVLLSSFSLRAPDSRYFCAMKLAKTTSAMNEANRSVGKREDCIR